MGTSITIEEMEKIEQKFKEKISTDSEAVASIGKTIAVASSWLGFTGRSILFIILSKRLLKNMDKQDAICFKCPEICEETFEARHTLEKIVNVWNRVIYKQEQNKIPKFIVRWGEHISEQFENKLENYWISSDKEIKTLAHSISEKLNKNDIRRTI